MLAKLIRWVGRSNARARCANSYYLSCQGQLSFWQEKLIRDQILLHWTAKATLLYTLLLPKQKVCFSELLKETIVLNNSVVNKWAESKTTFSLRSTLCFLLNILDSGVVLSFSFLYLFVPALCKSFRVESFLGPVSCAHLWCQHRVQHDKWSASLKHI